MPALPAVEVEVSRACVRSLSLSLFPKVAPLTSSGALACVRAERLSNSATADAPLAAPTSPAAAAPAVFAVGVEAARACVRLFSLRCL